jgi:hypothetical protein
VKSQHVTKEDLVVGAKVGFLTVTSVRPFVCQCVCGNEVKRTRTAIVKCGVRSCGCKRRTASPKLTRVKVGETYGIFTVIAQTDNARRWEVTCNRCKNASTMYETNFLYNEPKRCRRCD